jgi:hypothetical protein
MSKFRVGEKITIKTKEELTKQFVDCLTCKQELLLGKDAIIVCRIIKGHPYFRLDIDHENTDWHEKFLKKKMKEEINYFDRAIKFIEHYVPESDHKEYSEGVICKRLIILIGQNTFNHIIESTKEETDCYDEDYSFTTFHKQFRQTDVSGSADIDMIFWHFAQISEMPQRVYYGIQNKQFDGSPCDPNFPYFEKGWIE